MKKWKKWLIAAGLVCLAAIGFIAWPEDYREDFLPGTCRMIGLCGLFLMAFSGGEEEER